MRDWKTLRERYDPHGMYEKILGLPEQIGEAARLFQAPRIQTDGPRNVLLLGMGGSAIGGEIVRAATAGLSPVPVQLVRGYSVPEWCGRSTLVIATSYSGNTEETLSAVEEAYDRGATIAAVTSGGKLEEMVESRGGSLLKVPGGFPPRSAIGHLTVPVLLAMSEAGFSPDWRGPIDAARRRMEKMRDEWAGAGENEPVAIAESIQGSFPLIYHAEGEMTPVAIRWCGQLAENAKALSHRAAFPELNHNEVVGWEEPEWFLPRASLLSLRSDGDDPRVRRGMDAAIRLLKEKAGLVVSLDIKGVNVLERIFPAIYTGDFVSFYLALATGVDPTPVKRIDTLKSMLANHYSSSRSDGIVERRSP